MFPVDGLGAEEERKTELNAVAVFPCTGQFGPAFVLLNGNRLSIDLEAGSGRPFGDAKTQGETRGPVGSEAEMDEAVKRIVPLLVEAALSAGGRCEA